jgi:uncharacterized membrane protein
MRAAIAATAISLFALLPVEARANLTFCNDTGHTIQVSVGWQDSSDTWNSAGWYTLDGGLCQTALDGNLNKRYYYYYALDDHGDTWSGDYTFCTSETSFTIVGDSNCASRGYEERGFRRIDTSSYQDWTQHLHD